MLPVASLSTPTRKPSQNTNGLHKTESLALCAVLVQSVFIEPKFQAVKEAEILRKAVPFCAYEASAKVILSC
jgi:hypothetical protein